MPGILFPVFVIALLLFSFTVVGFVLSKRLKVYDQYTKRVASGPVYFKTQIAHMMYFEKRGSFLRRRKKGFWALLDGSMVLGVTMPRPFYFEIPFSSVSKIEIMPPGLRVHGSDVHVYFTNRHGNQDMIRIAGDPPDKMTKIMSGLNLPVVHRG